MAENVCLVPDCERPLYPLSVHEFVNKILYIAMKNCASLYRGNRDWTRVVLLFSMLNLNWIGNDANNNNIG